MTVKELLPKLLDRHHLSSAEAAGAMTDILMGSSTGVQTAAFLIALRQKGETAEEVAGFVSAMREHAVGVTVNAANAVDGCGTGGDHANTFNISTAASIIACAAGATVVKHGNRAVSSSCGSADVLEEAGMTIDPGPDVVEESIRKVGFGFLFAPRFHPAMRQVAPIRKEMGVRTVFNVLGPLSNPARVRHQVIGVYDKALMELMADVSLLTGCQKVLVVHSADGLDEFSISDVSSYVEVTPGSQEYHTIAPEAAGLKRHAMSAVRGGDSRQNALILEGVLNGELSAYRDASLLNAGAILYAADVVSSIAEGVTEAREVIDSGAARAKFKSIIDFSRSRAHQQ